MEAGTPQRKTKRRLAIARMIVGILLTLAPVFGLLATVLGMSRAFDALGATGIADPKTLSDSIGMSLVSTAMGVFLLPTGIIILTPSIVFFLRLRPPDQPPLVP